MEIEFSVVVPTKNRHYYLKYLVDYFKLIDSNKIELIIYDNSEYNLRQEFVLFLETINDSRIKYYEDDRELSQTGNCNIAVSKASGEYITLLGDDDIFSKYILDYIENWKRDGVEAILPNKGVYSWPDVQHRMYKDKLSGVYRNTNFSGIVRKVKTMPILQKVIKLGGTKMINLPRVYHGIVKRSILEKIFIETGTYFPGPSPDIANAVALCKYLTFFITIDIPLVISGVSVSSAAGHGAKGTHYGEISKVKQLPKNTATNWSQEVPFFWSGETIYAESVIQSLKKTGMSHLLQKFNFEYLYAMCFVYASNYKSEIKHTIKNQKFNHSYFKRIKTIYYFVSIWVNRFTFHLRNNVILLLLNYFQKKHTISTMQNILEVAIINDKRIEQKKVNENLILDRDMGFPPK